MKSYHFLKSWKAPFASMLSGARTADFRVNDRNFCVEDLLSLNEWDPTTKIYTGRILYAEVTDVASGFGIPEGHAMLSFKVTGSVNCE